MSKKKEAAGKRPGRRLTAALGAVAVVAVGTGVGSAFHPATSLEPTPVPIWYSLDIFARKRARMGRESGP